MLVEQGAAFGIDKNFFILSGADVATSLSKIQDIIQIFFAVLLWMFLRYPEHVMVLPYFYINNIGMKVITLYFMSIHNS